ncbi:MAG: MBL fold metallo-hydrolase [Firmicutes bacterium]|nr:MBL fold metallo-hydrolase [Bacillota bacterium]
MKIRFLGGAGEVGASCILASTESGKNILLDAGVRVSEEGTEMLPNLEPLNDIVLDAIIVSHAHLDHSGALPLVAKLSPGASIYATTATKDLARVLLYDSIKVAEFSEGLQLFNEEDAEQALDRMVTYGFETSFEAAEGIQAVFLRAGHILGAAAILLQTGEGTLLYTGDFTTFEQETVWMQGFSGVLKRGADVVIAEATYGSRIHAPRFHEVQRLLDAVGESLDSGGQVLIPAFAVGRSQEILLALRNYMRKTKRKYPVYVDGLIRNVNTVFARNPNYLKRRYEKEVLRGNELFYTSGIEAVGSRSQRDKILASKDPCVIVASSGMLTGGVSPIYAEKIVESEKNLLAIVGYQDEESPGRRLMDLIDLPESERTIVLNEREHRVRCKVGKFGLSAHADSLGIVASVKALMPNFVLLNHGNEESLAGLSQALADELPDTRIEVADSLGVHEYSAADGGAKRRYSLKPQVHRIALHKEEPVDTEELWQHLVETDTEGTTLTVADLMMVWHGPQEISEEEKQAFRKKIRESLRFRSAYTNPNVVYVLTEEEYVDAVTPKPMEQNAAWALLQERLREFGLQKVGFASDGSVALYFPTPKYAERCADEIASLEQEILRSIEVAPNSNMEFLKAKIKSDLADEFGIRVNRDPSFGAQTVTVREPAGLEQPGICGRTLGEYARAFEDETGYRLIFKVEGQSLLDQVVAARRGGAEQEPWNVASLDAALSRSVGAPGEPLMEQNMAKGMIDDAFAGAVHHPKISIYRDEGRMALAFITPQIGETYRAVLDQLEDATGWKLEIQESARVNELADLARELLAANGLGGMKVGVHGGYAEARGPVDVDGSVAEKLSEDYSELTGYELRFRRT